MIKTHSCLTVACNLCNETFTDDEDGIPHFDTIQEARDYQDAWGDEYQWTISDDGYAICSADDEEHVQARAALSAAELQPQVPGQLELAETGGAR